MSGRVNLGFAKASAPLQLCALSASRPLPRSQLGLQFACQSPQVGTDPWSCGLCQLPLRFSRSVFAPLGHKEQGSDARQTSGITRVGFHPSSLTKNDTFKLYCLEIRQSLGLFSLVFLRAFI